MLKLNYLLVCVLLVGFSISLKAQNTDDIDDKQKFLMLEKEYKKAGEDLLYIHNALENIDTKQKRGYNELKLIEQKIETRKSNITTIDRTISLRRKQIEEKKEAIQSLERDLNEVRQSARDLAVKYYNMHLPDNTLLMYFMASESVSQASKRVKYVREILLLYKTRANKIKEMTDRLNNEIAEMTNAQALLSSDISEFQKQMITLELEEKKSKSVASELKRQEAELTKQYREVQKTRDALSLQLKEFIKEELLERKETGITDNMIVATKSFEEMKGFMPWPAIGPVIYHYGDNKTNSTYNVVLQSNQGIDIQTAESAEVYAVHKGVVKRVATIQNSEGYTILIQHGTYYTVYTPIGSPSVKVGDNVTARQKIGNVRKSNDVSMLRFQLLKDTNYFDPEKWLTN